MSYESPRSSVFTFQSSVHSSNVLRSLNEQRKRDVLCDLTVVVESKGFRAHRSVLASCSEYFHARVTSLVGQGLVITLPDEVTADGFDPLLQFAYTAKLLFTKENILEIRRCAAILGFHDLDKACFDFLIPKFLDSSRSAQAAPRKICCGRKSWREKLSKARSSGNIDGDDNDNGDDSSKVKEEIEDPESLGGKHIPQLAAPTGKPAVSAPGSLGPDCPGVAMSIVAMSTDPALRCLKYRKFQNACGKERSSSPQVPSSYSSSSASSAPVASGQAPPVYHREEGGSLARSISGGCKSESDKVSGNKVAAVAMCPPPALVPLPRSPGGGGFGEALDSGGSPSVGSVGAEPDCGTQGPCGARFLAPATQGKEVEEEEEEECGDNHERPINSDPAHPGLSGVPGLEGGGERSNIEREVAEHLAEGFWSAYLDPPGESSTGASSAYGCCKRLALTPGGLDCPFLREPGLSQEEKRSYDSSLNSEDSELEGASECSSTQRAPEVLLPFPVEQIVSLSRTDFHNTLKQHQLSREQLDFAHDIRRRSKNCIAARRCRKRKLDCIHNLEGEIKRLRCEKQMLQQEQARLTQLKLKTWQDISGLCQSVFSKAALQPEQLQVLAKYSNPDCPLSTLLTPLAPPSNSACPPMDPSPGETQRDPQVLLPLEPEPAANHNWTLSGSSPDGRGLSAITGPCLDMSCTCTRDE